MERRREERGGMAREEISRHGGRRHGSSSSLPAKGRKKERLRERRLMEKEGEREREKIDGERA